MASFVYGNGALASISGSGLSNPIDFLNDTMKAGLSNSTHSPNKDDAFLDDGGADDFVDGELSGGNYSRKTLASKTLVYDSANDRVEYDAADVTWTAINAGTAARLSIFRDTGTNTTSRLLANVDTGGFPVVTNGGDLTVTWDSEGIIQLTT